jgi:hypothetical protein
MRWAHERRHRHRPVERIPVRADGWRGLVLPGGLIVMENVILSVGASIVMLYLLIALIRPERF